MAYATGVAANHLDLMDKLATFLTGAPAWVALKQQPMRGRGAPPTGRIAFNGRGQYPDTMPDLAPVGMQRHQVLFYASGTLNVPASGSYQIGLDVRGSALVLIDGTPIISVYQTGSAGALNNFARYATVNLTAGARNIEVRGVQEAGDPVNYPLSISLGWKKPGDENITIIPASAYANLMFNWQTMQGTRPGSDADMIRNTQGRYLLLKGPGLSGDKQIFIELVSYQDSSADTSNIQMFYGVGAGDSEGLLGGSAGDRWMPLVNTSMQYWFTGNGQRFTITAKVSTDYISGYAGFFLPYALPDEWPYPIIVGGSAADNIKYTDTGNPAYRSYWHPFARNWSGQPSYSSLSMRHANGQEKWFSNANQDSYPFLASTYPYMGDVQFRPAVPGNYALMPIVLFSRNQAETFGELDGVYHINGYNVASEDIIKINGVDHIVFQSANQIGATAFAAIKLE
jgi:hypothetical protein